MFLQIQVGILGRHSPQISAFQGFQDLEPPLLRGVWCQPPASLSSHSRAAWAASALLAPLPHLKQDQLPFLSASWGLCDGHHLANLSFILQERL